MSQGPPDTRALLRAHGLAPKKSFGQNFLVSERAIAQIASACVPDAELGRARVLEIGAGLGALTRALVARSRHLTAVERDRDLVPILDEIFADEREAGRFRLLEADAQALVLGEALGGHEANSPRVLCGNLPYQITGRLLELAVHEADAFDRAVFMVQAEVADRLVASPSTKAYGALTVFVRAAFTVKRVLTVPPGAFHPAPEVTSAVVKLEPRPEGRIEETPVFRALVRKAFEKRRKTLKNAWAGVAPPESIERAAASADVRLDARGETLGVEAFAGVAHALESALRRT